MLSASCIIVLTVRRKSCNRQEGMGGRPSRVRIADAFVETTLARRPPAESAASLAEHKIATVAAVASSQDRQGRLGQRNIKGPFVLDARAGQSDMSKFEVDLVPAQSADLFTTPACQR